MVNSQVGVVETLVNPMEILLEYEVVLADWGYTTADAEPASELDALRVLERQMRRGEAADPPAA